MIDASRSLIDDGTHFLTHSAEIVGAIMVVGGFVIVVVRSMLKGLDKRTKLHIDAATKPLIPNGGDSIGDLPDALKALKLQNQADHAGIKTDITQMDAKNDREHKLIQNELKVHKANTDDKIDVIQEHQQTLVERLLFRREVNREADE